MGKINYTTEQRIIAIVCHFYNINSSDLSLKTRKRAIIEPRQVCFYLLRIYSKLTLGKIALVIGSFSHVNVLHAINVIEDLIHTDKVFAQKIEDIKNTIEDRTKPRVYIAGKVTGLPMEAVQEKFKKAEIFLQKYGFSTINPTEIVEPTTDWEDAMRICIIHLMTCNYIYLLPDWKESEGAQIEVKIAKLMKIKSLKIDE